MALFRSARDAGVDLLTRVYQVNRESWEELASLLECEGNDPQAAAMVRDPLANAVIGAWTAGDRQSDALAGHAWQLRNDVRQTCAVTHAIMYGLAHKGGVTADDVEALGNLSKQIAVDWCTKEGKPLPAEGWINPLEIQPVAHSLTSTRLLIDIRRATEQLLFDAVDGRARLGICVECSSVFVLRPQHPQQAFCSRRCSHRRGQRKRMRELKE